MIVCCWSFDGSILVVIAAAFAFAFAFAVAAAMDVVVRLKELNEFTLLKEVGWSVHADSIDDASSAADITAGTAGTGATEPCTCC